MKAHFDGRALIPDGPVNLPVGSTFEIELTSIPESTASKRFVKYPLAELAKLLSQEPDPGLPVDAAINHDYYL